MSGRLSERRSTLYNLAKTARLAALVEVLKKRTSVYEYRERTFSCTVVFGLAKTYRTSSVPTAVRPDGETLEPGYVNGVILDRPGPIIARLALDHDPWLRSLPIHILHRTFQNHWGDLHRYGVLRKRVGT